MRVDNIIPTINVPYVHTPDAVPYNPNQWQVYCKTPEVRTAELKTSDVKNTLDVETAEMTPNIQVGEVMPTIHTATGGELNVGSGEITVSTPLQYKEEEIPTTDL